MSKSPTSSEWVAFVLGHVIQPAAQTSDFFFLVVKLIVSTSKLCLSPRLFSRAFLSLSNKAFAELEHSRVGGRKWGMSTALEIKE